MSDALPEPEPTAGPELDARPFVVAAGLFLVIAVLAVVFLRSDDRGRLVRPSGISVVAEDTVRLRYDGPFRASSAEIIQVGYALGDEDVYVELVLEEVDCGEVTTRCPPAPDRLEVDLVLPVPIGDRSVRPGTGRALAECESRDGRTVCR